MKLVIAGSRDFDFICTNDIATFITIHLFRQDIHSIVYGGAKGIDEVGKHYALANQLPFTLFEADWTTHGKAAGPIRNKQMAEYGDALLLIWDGESRGSKNMKEQMLKLGKPVYEVVLRSYNK